MDPLAAARIVEYLKAALQPHQGLLFSSHRVDETISVCNKVLLLLRGQKYIDGDIDGFNSVAFQFFQVDVLVNGQRGGSGACEDMEEFIRCMCQSCNGEGNIEKIVQYSHSLVRLTFEKGVISLFSVWNLLDLWKERGIVKSFAFRIMDMEEVLSTILSTS